MVLDFNKEAYVKGDLVFSDKCLPLPESFVLSHVSCAVPFLYVPRDVTINRSASKQLKAIKAFI